MEVVCRAAALAELRELAAAAYPEEGCGVLIGVLRDSPLIVAATSGRNLRSDRRRDRYELDPGDIVAAERRARRDGYDVVGFWHSHPDHPARPSAFDTERAWAEYVYAICATSLVGSGEVRAFRLDEAARVFTEVPLRVAAAIAEQAQ